MKSVYIPAWDGFIRYYVLAGPDPVIVYLPGISIPSTLGLLPVATHPGMPAHRAILVDYFGSGASDHPERFSYALADHAATVAAVVDHEGVTSCRVVGHSMGGTVGMLLAMQRPTLVENLIVAEANLTPGGGQATSRIAAHSRDDYLDRVHGETIAAYRRDAVGGDARAARMLSAWGTASAVGLYENSVALVNVERSLARRFFELAMPRTFVYGADTVPAHPRDAGPDTPDPIELQAHGIHTAVVPEAGHAMMWDNLDGFVDVLRRALDPAGGSWVSVTQTHTRGAEHGH